jgi:hypothetical protein
MTKGVVAVYRISCPQPELARRVMVAGHPVLFTDVAGSRCCGVESDPMEAPAAETCQPYRVHSDSDALLVGGTSQ